jgi:hypothetical protein
VTIYLERGDKDDRERKARRKDMRGIPPQSNLDINAFADLHLDYGPMECTTCMLLTQNDHICGPY